MSHTLASNHYHEQEWFKKKNVGEKIGSEVNVKLLSKENVYPLGKNTENISNSILRQRPKCMLSTRNTCKTVIQQE